MKPYEHEIQQRPVIREVPRQNGMTIFRWVMLLLAFIAVVIVTRHKILKVEIGLFEVSPTNEGEEELTSFHPLDHIQEWPEWEPIGVTFRRYNLTYTHGKRVQGDKLVFYKRKRNFFRNARNFSFSVRYPTRHRTLGATITSINLYVLQTSKVGQAVIRRGGVGYRNVTMDVTSYNTTQCRYTVRIYGVNKHK